MASRSRHGGHLDATAARDVVYCHACSHEWHHDQSELGLNCPVCGGAFTEIISADSDPRDMDQSVSLPSSPTSHAARDNDASDPEEADIEEFVGPHGFVHRRSVRSGPEDAHHDPGVEHVFNRFYEMVQTFGEERNADAREAPDHGAQEPAAWSRIHRATFRSGASGGATASVTIFSGPPPGAHGMGRGADGSAIDPFQAIFSAVLRDLTPPQGEHQGAPPPNFARGLQDILSLFSGNGVAGDAVYSQEGLDRIITELMEANPQSNAAPPASEEALMNLDRRTVDQDMLETENKKECTICIDEMHVGDVAVTLPCKHWFHEECVTLWLKEHNTCPICRTPVESRNGSGQNGNWGGGDDGPHPGQPRFVHAQGGSSAPGRGEEEAAGAPRGFSRSFSRSFSGTFLRQERPSADAPAGIAARPSGRAQRNEALRAISTIREEMARERGRWTPSQRSYDTSRMQRRTSVSPTSPREARPWDYGSRMRQRSPSQSSRRGSGRQAAGHGPFSWLRGRFTGGNGPPQEPPPRDERR